MKFLKWFVSRVILEWYKGICAVCLLISLLPLHAINVVSLWGLDGICHEELSPRHLFWLRYADVFSLWHLLVYYVIVATFYHICDYYVKNGNKKV